MLGLLSGGSGGTATAHMKWDIIPPRRCWDGGEGEKTKNKRKKKRKKKIKKKKKSALTGNRTRASRVAGENSTTEPSMLRLQTQATFESSI